MESDNTSSLRILALFEPALKPTCLYSVVNAVDLIGLAIASNE